MCGVFHVFGQVTDPLGAPVASAPIELAFYNLDREGNAFEDGECKGEVTFSESDTTAADGRYEHSITARFCTARCMPGASTFQRIARPMRGSPSR